MHYIFYDQNNVPHELKSSDDFLKYIRTGQLGKKRDLYDTETGKLLKADGNIHFENARKAFENKQQEAKTIKSQMYSKPPKKKKSPFLPIFIAMLISFLGIGFAVFFVYEESSNAEYTIEFDTPDTRDFTRIENILSLKYEYTDDDIDYQPLIKFFEKQEKKLSKEYFELDQAFFSDFDTLLQIKAFSTMDIMEENIKIVDGHKKNTLKAREKIKKLMEKAVADNIKMTGKYSTNISEKVNTFSNSRLEKGYSDFYVYLNYRENFYQTLKEIYTYMRVTFNKYEVTEEGYQFNSETLTKTYNSYSKQMQDTYVKILDSKKKIDSLGFFNVKELDMLRY